MNKSHLRQTMKTRRSSLSEKEKQSANISICNKISMHPFVQQAEIIASYQAINDEIDPSNLCSQLSNKKWLFPRINGDVLIFSEINNDHPGRKNSFGLLEPTHPDNVPLNKIDIMLVPLLAFDNKRFRLGYGGGYYDRSLAKTTQRPYLIGLAHEWQKLNELPKDPWDIPLDDVIIA